MSKGGEVVFKPVGVVRTKFSDEEVKTREDEFESVVEILPEYEDALDGLEGFSHIYVICYFNRLRPDQMGSLKVRPRRLLRKGFKLEELPLKGVFALDSPTRPNPIGLSLVRLIRRDGRRLIVRGLDYFDGTPVLDVKPYPPDHRISDVSVPAWHQELLEKAGHV